MPKILPIKIYPCPGLRQKSQVLKTEELGNKEIKQLISDMEKTMVEKDGIGLAAPQVGKNLRIVVISTADGSLVLINPKILRKSWRTEIQEEGCLSFPEIFGLVKRSLKIKLVALDRTGKKIKFKASGLFARVIQHEVDHLDGILFIDKAKEIVKGKDKLAGLEKK
ncbi:MAG: peptide deformylase [Patescibacteria group bacterium]|jgi:peptide deformylase